MKEKRLDFIDIMKGILIVSMVIGHTNSIYTPFIYLFISYGCLFYNIRFFIQ